MLTKAQSPTCEKKNAIICLTKLITRVTLDFRRRTIIIRQYSNEFYRSNYNQLQLLFRRRFHFGGDIAVEVDDDYDDDSDDQNDVAVFDEDGDDDKDFSSPNVHPNEFYNKQFRQVNNAEEYI